MSCIFIVTPIVVSAWPVLAGIISASAATLGYRVLNAVNEPNQEIDQQTVELHVGNSNVMAEQMRRGESIVLTKDQIRIIISLDPQKRISAQVQGPKTILDSELQKTGQEFLNRIVQQYAYQQVMLTLKDKGFSLVQEQADSEGRIQLKVRKFE